MFVTVNEPNIIEPWRHEKRVQVLFISETFSVPMYSCKNLHQMEFVPSHLKASFKRGISLLSHTKIMKCTVNDPTTTTRLPDCKSYIATLAKTVHNCSLVTWLCIQQNCVESNQSNSGQYSQTLRIAMESHWSISESMKIRWNIQVHWYVLILTWQHRITQGTRNKEEPLNTAQFIHYGRALQPLSVTGIRQLKSNIQYDERSASLSYHKVPRTWNTVLPIFKNYKNTRQDATTSQETEWRRSTADTCLEN